MEFSFLESKSLKISRDCDGILKLSIDDRSYHGVKVRCAFPLFDSNHYLIFYDSDDREIGIVKDMEALDPESRNLVKVELSRRYFIPSIQSINSIRKEFGVTHFDVETDRGSRKFMVKERRTNVASLGLRRLLITDVDGNRFEIRDLAKLNPRSIALLSRII